jgi:hypothetical protein
MLARKNMEKERRGFERLWKARGGGEGGRKRNRRRRRRINNGEKKYRLQIAVMRIDTLMSHLLRGFGRG